MKATVAIGEAAPAEPEELLATTKFTLNGQPVEVMTEVDVNFTLSQ